MDWWEDEMQWRDMIGEDEVAELKTITSKHSVKQATRLHTHSESSPRHITDFCIR